MTKTTDMIKYITIFSILFFIGIEFSNQAQGSLVFYPSINPDGDKIAFSYQGDIWVVNADGQNPSRLTIHEGYDTKPLWSKDGSQIAFQSNRYGNNDIFIIPSKGGNPKRLTFHSNNDVISSFNHDNSIYFETRRDFAQVERESEIHSINISGGTPARILNNVGFDASLSPNGKFIVFTSGSCRISREAYKGPANRDVWLYNIKNKSYAQLTTYEGNDFYPQWGDDATIYFLTSRSGRYNIHQVKIDDNGNKSGDFSQLTKYTDMGINSFRISNNAKHIVAVKGDKLYKIDVVSKSSKEIKLNLESDYRFDPMVRKSYSGDVTELVPSPNGKYSALVIRGEVFVIENDKKKSRTINVSNSAYRDQGVMWLNDSTLLFTSDREGQYDIYLAKSIDPNETNIFKSLKLEITRITKTSQDESDLVLSPDGKKLAYDRGRGQLIVADISSDNKLENEKILHDSWSSPDGVAWSPNSEWLAYSTSDLDFNEEIFIHKADNSAKPVNVSMHPKSDTNPIWSQDGKKLGFSSDRNNSNYDVWFIWLDKKDWEKTKQDWDEDEDIKAPKKDKKEEQGVDVKIDFEKIHERQVQVTAFSGNEILTNFSKKGDFLYYITLGNFRSNSPSESDLFKIKWDGTEKKAVTKNNSQINEITIDSKSEYLYIVTRGGKPGRIKLASDAKENLPISAKLKIDYYGESEQMFEEAWNAIKNGFYDPDFHGQNWNSLKKIYKPLVMKTTTRDDFRTVFDLMLGQLNASHMGIRNVQDRADVQRQTTGLLGIEIEPNSKGEVKVLKVTTDMPADRTNSKLSEGDIITAVNGESLKKETNFYSLFEGTENEKVYLSVKNSKGTVREVVIRPKRGNFFENYNAWVKERKKLVEQYSNGKLGYIHIQGMNWTSFERFERELTAAGYGKQGIVIDVRYNGGGWTTDYLMAVLNVKQHAYTVPRGAAKDLKKEQTKFVNHYPYSERLPLASWTKPSIAMCNENSYSNAEIFSHAYKNLGIGTLVGKPTFGAVISTGAQRLIDGSFVRMPFRGWYVKATKSNMEHGPAVPDIELNNALDDKAKGKDTQLKKAVDTLLEQIESK